MSTTFVLIHGSNANSFSWAPLQRELALLGQRSLAVDLPGHGPGAVFPEGYQAPQDAGALASAVSGLASVTLAETVEHVADVVRRAREHGPVVAVAHSRGGVVLTALGNTYPELLSRMIYVSAWCPVERTVVEYTMRSENAGSALNSTDLPLLADPAVVGAIRMNWRTGDAAQLAALRSAMLADGTDAEFRALVNLFEPDEILDAGTADDTAQAETWGRIPRTYVRLTGDASMLPALQDLFVAEADALTPDNPFDVVSLESSHCRFLLHPEEAARLLAARAA